MEQGAFVDAGVTERKKITISPDMDEKMIQEKFGVSRTTAWRAKKQGWLFKNYHERLVLWDSDWAEAHVEEIRASAKTGARFALAMLSKTVSEIQPFEFDDLVSCAYVKLMELSGHPDREIPRWRDAVAKNAALDFIKTQVISAGKVFSDEEYDELRHGIKRRDA